MDHVLTDETRTRIIRSLLGILSTPNSAIEETRLVEELLLSIDMLLLSRFYHITMQVEVLID